MPDLPDFLLARIAEDEEDARMLTLPWTEDNDGPRRHWPGYTAEELAGDFDVIPDPQQRALMVGHARFLAECKAKRQALTEYDQALAQRAQLANTPHSIEGSVRLLTALRFVKLLASVYADHPDFDPSWRVE